MDEVLESEKRLFQIQAQGKRRDHWYSPGHWAKGVFTMKATKKLAKKATKGIVKKDSEEAGKVVAQKG